MNSRVSERCSGVEKYNHVFQRFAVARHQHLIFFRAQAPLLTMNLFEWRQQQQVLLKRFLGVVIVL